MLLLCKIRIAIPKLTAKPPSSNRFSRQIQSMLSYPVCLYHFYSLFRSQHARVPPKRLQLHNLKTYDASYFCSLQKSQNVANSTHRKKTQPIPKIFHGSTLYNISEFSVCCTCCLSHPSPHQHSKTLTLEKWLKFFVSKLCNC